MLSDDFVTTPMMVLPCGDTASGNLSTYVRTFKIFGNLFFETFFKIKMCNLRCLLAPVVGPVTIPAQEHCKQSTMYCTQCENQGDLKAAQQFIFALEQVTLAILNPVSLTF